MPMRWSAVFAGAMVTLGCWLFLQFLGSGVAMMNLGANDVGHFSGLGVITGGWWFGVAIIIAAFIGGLVAGGLELTRGARMGAMYGVVSWALSTVAGIVASFAFATLITSSVVQLGSAALQATGNVASQAASGLGTQQISSAASALGINENDLVAPINQKLQAAGKPPITAQQLEQTIREVAKRGVRQGHLDRQTLVTAIANQTSLSRTDAQQVVGQISDRADKIWNQVQSKVQDAKQTVAKGVNSLGYDVLWIGIALILALIASAIGGSLGAAWRTKTEGGPRREDEADPVPPPEHRATVVEGTRPAPAT